MDTGAGERVWKAIVLDLTKEAVVQISLLHRVICGAVLEGILYLNKSLSLSSPWFALSGAL